MKKTLAIDFDGVIHKYSKGWNDGSVYDEPMPGAFEGIQRLQENGYSVFIHSTRPAPQIVEWLSSHGVAATEVPEDTLFWNSPMIGVTNRKLPAIAYIDDRAVRFHNWTDVLNYYA